MNSVWSFLSNFLSGLASVWSWLETTGFNIPTGDGLEVLHISVLEMLTGSLLVVLGVILVCKLADLVIPV